MGRILLGTVAACLMCGPVLAQVVGRVAPNLASLVTASEIEGIRNKIRPCWNPPSAAAQNLIVTLSVELRQEGTPVSAAVVDTGRYGSDSGYRVAADAAIRAVMNPRCQPWPLDLSKWASWKVVQFNFDARDY
jgi:hypothetical protein